MMKPIVGLTIILVVMNCARVRHHPNQQEIDGIIFIDEKEEQRREKAARAAQSATKAKTRQTETQKNEPIRDFEAMDGIIFLNLDDQIAERPGKPIQVHHQKFQTGYASYYAMTLKGNTTACGERYDPYQLTAAHPSLPFGSMVRVTNLFNNESVVVRINDRGPKVKSRIIDLSYAAAQKLDMISAGVVQVAIEVLSIPEQSR